MKFLKSIADRIFSVRLANETGVAIEARYKSAVMAGDWTSDAELRRLAKEYRAGRTYWVFAGDLSELYKKFDRGNADRALKIEIGMDVAAQLKKQMDASMHLNRGANNPIGPSHVGNMRLVRNGEQLARIDYFYKVTDSEFVFHFHNKSGPDEKRVFECGMNWDEIVYARYGSTPS